MNYSDPSTEEAVIKSLVVSPQQFCDSKNRLRPDLFHCDTYRALLNLTSNLRDRHPDADVSIVCSEIRHHHRLDDYGGEAFLNLLPIADPLGSSSLDYHLSRLEELRSKREEQRLGKELCEGPSKADRARIASELQQLDEGQGTNGLSRLLKERRFDASVTPPQVEQRFSIGDNTIATVGNLVVIGALEKSGKTAAVSGLLASPMNPSGDTLGFNSSNESGGALIHIDTEQSLADAHRLGQRVLRRAGLADPPRWFYSYAMVGQPLHILRQAISDSLKIGLKECGSIHSLVLDGLADFIASPNDETESNALVADLHRLAIEYSCVIVCVIHFSPGTEKTRGHLGSQLQRKAETNLCLTKDADDVVSIHTERSRNCVIRKGTGPSFAWSSEHGMHMSVAVRSDHKASEKARHLRELAEDVFGEHEAFTEAPLQGLRRTEIIERIIVVTKKKDEAARKCFDMLRLEKLIKSPNEQAKGCLWKLTF